ncbi:MAG: carbohydrate-binding protein [Bacillota bacterium]
MVQAWNDMQKGVEVKSAGYGRDVTICYNGLLDKSGADQVFIHTGYGLNWQNTSTVKMDRTARGWEKTFPMHTNQMAFCFKDSAANWDNNGGHNWIVSS